MINLLLRRLVRWIAFGFGSGLLPWMPGTWGTLVAVLIYWFTMRSLSPLYYIGFNLFLTLFAIWVSAIVSRDMKVHDSPQIVIDEMVGFWWTMLWIPPHPLFVLLGFLNFRFFDVLKPPPIKWLDKHVKGGFGIVLDDLIAALLAWLVLQGYIFIGFV